VLKEVQMPPRLLLGIARLQPRPVALRAGERRPAREIDPQIQPLGFGIELDARDPPRFAQPERGLEEKKILRLHQRLPSSTIRSRSGNQPDRTLPTLIVEEPQQVRRGVYHDVSELIAAIKHFIEGYNERAQPFLWTKTADQVLAKAIKQQPNSGTLR
jgi:hypothetical protein